MTTKEEINKAIAAHGSWKQKLKLAIETGRCESTPEKVKQDCHCSFGKWLHERIDPKVKDSPYYGEVLQLHAEFHREAGSILEVALKGQTTEAHDRMKLGSHFAKTSAKLIHVLQNWQANL